MQIVFSKRAYLSIVSETSQKKETETGGTFLGCYENGIWYVIETIKPGPNSIFEKSYFEYDRKYTERQINKKARLYKSDMTLIGLWHSHLSSVDEFSPIDNETNSEYAKLSKNGAISIIVNTDLEFRMTAYHVVHPLKYTKIMYAVGDDLIPKYLIQRTTKEKRFQKQANPAKP